MVYPPGIPILYPGEEITEDIIHYIEMLKSTNVSVQGLEDSSLEYINIIEDYAVCPVASMSPPVQDCSDVIEQSLSNTEVFEPAIMNTG